jgi:outer membrane protein TolC
MVGPDYVRPDVPMPEDWLEAQTAETPDVEADLSQWWTVFEDPILDRLVEDAYRQNLSLQIAGLRILEARAVLGIAVADLWPQQQQINGSIINNGLGSDDSWNAEIGFDAGWELDLWGKFRRGVESDLASFQASIADYDDVLVSLTSEVARTYFQLRTSEQRLRVARDNVQIQTRSLEITESQFNAGEVTELDVTQARTLLRSTEATMPGFERDARRPGAVADYSDRGRRRSSGRAVAPAAGHPLCRTVARGPKRADRRGPGRPVPAFLPVRLGRVPDQLPRHR